MAETPREDGVFAGKTVVETKKGQCTVREICIEDLQVVGVELVNLLQILPEDQLTSQSGESVMGLLKLALENPDLIGMVKRILAQMTDTQVVFWEKMPLTDLGKCVRAFTEVNDIEELRSYFFVLRRKLVALGLLVRQAPKEEESEKADAEVK